MTTKEVDDLIEKFPEKSRGEIRHCMDMLKVFILEFGFPAIVAIGLIGILTREIIEKVIKND